MNSEIRQILNAVDLLRELSSQLDYDNLSFLPDEVEDVLTAFERLAENLESDNDD